jgi:hypothetical protein
VTVQARYHRVTGPSLFWSGFGAWFRFQMRPAVQVDVVGALYPAEDGRLV